MCRNAVAFQALENPVETFPMIGKLRPCILFVVLFFAAVLSSDAGWWSDLRKDCYEGYTRFHDAAKVGDMKKLEYYLKKGADINQRSRSAKCTALGCAVRWRQHEVAKFLLEQGADPSIPFRFAGVYRTPLQVAAASGRMNFVELLMAYVDSPDEDMDVEYPAWCRNSAFSWACSAEHLDAARYLLDRGANVNIRNRSNSGPPLVLAVQQLRLESVRFLLENGADTELEDKNHGFTPLEWAENMLDGKLRSVSSTLRQQQYGAVTKSHLQAGTNRCVQIIRLLKVQSGE